MRLDPVFVVAPKPKPPTMPTRRAFLLAGATFTFGAAVGGACGYSVGAERAVGDAGEEDLASSGDHELDELRRLAVKAPIEELVEKRMIFLNSFTKVYPRDPYLWTGAGRLAKATIAGQPFSDRRLFARFLAQIIEGSDPKYAGELRPLAAELRKVE